MSAADIAKGLGGHRSADGYLCRCPVPSHGKGKGDKHPSLLVKDGASRVLVTCFAGCDRSDVINELKHCGLLESDVDPTRTQLRPRRIEQSGREPEPDPEALAQWQAAGPIEGTLGEHYLRHYRGIDSPIPATLRFLSDVRYPPSGVSLPALVAAVARPDRKIIAIQLTFLRPSDGAKAKVNVPRLTVGRLGTGAVRLAAATETLGIAEGVETALSAMLLSGVPCWASLGGQRLSKVSVPADVTEIHIFADNDAAGKAAAEKAVGRFTQVGKRVVLRWPPVSCKDWNDVLLSRRRAA